MNAGEIPVAVAAEWVRKEIRHLLPKAGAPPQQDMTDRGDRTLPAVSMRTKRLMKGRSMKTQMTFACLLCVLAIGGLAGTPQAAQQQDPLLLLPKELHDASIIGWADVAKLAASPGMQAMMQAVPPGGAGVGPLDLLAALGLKEPKNPATAAFALNWSDYGTGTSCIVAAAGTWNQAAAYEAISRFHEKAAPVEHGGCKLLALPKDDDEDETRIVFGIIDDAILVLGSQPLANGVIDVYQKKAEALPPDAALPADLRKLEGKPLKFSVNPATLPPELWEDAPAGAPGFPSEKIKSILVTGSVKRSIVTCEAAVATDSGESAKLLKAAFEKALAPVANEPNFLSMMTPEMSIDGSTVKLVADMDARMAILPIMLLPALSNARAEARALKCKNNLKQIGTALRVYLDGPGRRNYPSSLKQLVDSKVVEEPLLFICPEDPYDGKDWHCSYGSIFDLTDKKLTDRLPGTTMMAWDDKPRHSGRCVLFCDTHVDCVKEKEFQKLLEELKKQLAEMK